MARTPWQTHASGHAWGQRARETSARLPRAAARTCRLGRWQAHRASGRVEWAPQRAGGRAGGQTRGPRVHVQEVVLCAYAHGTFMTMAPHRTNSPARRQMETNGSHAGSNSRAQTRLQSRCTTPTSVRVGALVAAAPGRAVTGMAERALCLCKVITAVSRASGACGGLQQQRWPCPPRSWPRGPVTPSI